jgi:hypothetical protein
VHSWISFIALPPPPSNIEVAGGLCPPSVTNLVFHDLVPEYLRVADPIISSKIHAMQCTGAFHCKTEASVSYIFISFKLTPVCVCAGEYKSEHSFLELK